MAEYRHKEYFPRRTNLASPGARTGAFIVDVAIFAIVFAIFYLGVFRFVYQDTLITLQDQFYGYQIDSTLCYRDESGIAQIYESTDERIQASVQYYYLNYLTGDVPEGSNPSPDYNQNVVVDGTDTGLLPKDYYTISWYNTNILEISENPLDSFDTGYFTYPYTTDEAGNITYDKSQVGIPKTSRYDSTSESVLSISDADIKTYFWVEYQEAFTDLSSRGFYTTVYNENMRIQALVVMFPTLIGLAVTYLLFPYIFKNGATVGKLAFHLGLANMDGYEVSKWRIALRPALAIVIVLIDFLALYAVNIYIGLMVALLPFLISWVLTLASPKKCALHDYISQTVVIDVKTSEIFKNSLEEHITLSKEEGLPIDREMLARSYSDEAINEAYKRNAKK